MIFLQKREERRHKIKNVIVFDGWGKYASVVLTLHMSCFEWECIRIFELIAKY